jgi:DNA-binding MarR family transcriptional regulator
LPLVESRSCLQEEPVTEALRKAQLVEGILALADTLFRLLLPTVPRGLLSLDITMPQTKILILLYIRGPRRMSDIAAELDVALPTATSLVDRLVEKHYVVRETLPEDRRVVLCLLSEAGEQVVRHIWDVARERSAEILRAMEIPKLEMFSEALQAMHEVALAEQQMAAQ